VLLEVEVTHDPLRILKLTGLLLWKRHDEVEVTHDPLRILKQIIQSPRSHVCHG